MTSSPTILIVDDESWNIKVLERLLKNNHYEYVSVSSGIEALKIVEEKSIDLILLDIMMPEMDGFEVCKKIKGNYKLKSIPVILVTALTESGDKVKGLDAGASDFLSKPIDQAELLARVRAHLRIKAMSDQLEEWNHTLEEKVKLRTIEIQTKHKELVEAYHKILESLASSLDLREHETGKHSLRVAYFTTELARKWCIEGRELQQIAIGALLHDVGKIGVPDRVLLKPGKLTEDEWKLMRMHPELGWKMVHDIDFIGKGREIVLHHQERYDGGGYPHRLKGEEIYIGARFFSVADTLDAILSKRPYKEALPYEFAAEEIKKNSGRQFDPQVVDLFLKIPQEKWSELKEVAEVSTCRDLIKSVSGKNAIF